MKYVKGLIKTINKKNQSERFSTYAILFILLGYMLAFIPLFIVQLTALFSFFLGFLYLFKFLWIEFKQDILKFIKEVKENSN